LVGVKAIATNRHADSEDLSFARSHCANKVGIRYFVTSRDLMWKDEHNYVVAKNGIVNRARFVETLSALSPFCDLSQTSLLAERTWGPLEIGRG
jgi:hypothetical protein